MKPHILRPTALAVIIAALATPLSAQPLDCMIQPHQIVQVGTAAPGVIEQLTVERGDLVTRGQVVAQLNAGVERAQLTVARERAAQVGEVQAAVGSRELADRELVRAKDLHGQEFVSGAYLDKARAEAEVASGRTVQAEERRRQASREVELAAAQLAQRTIRSPIDGVVVERYLSPGEYVDQKPVMRIASIDPLRVDVLVPAAAFGRVQVGDRGVVVPELFNQRKHEATVSMVDRVIDAASNTFRVRLELPNPGRQLPAGLRCKVNLGDSLLAGANPAPAPSADAAPASSQPMVTANAAAARTPSRQGAAVPVAATTRVSVDPSPKRENSASFDPQTAAMHALENWRKAWMLKDLAGYFSAYVPDFHGEQKSAEAWRSWREERIRAASDIELRVSDAQFEVLAPERVKVEFRQEFRSAQLRAEVRKTIVFVLDDGRWLIEEERLQR
jgi:cobalt-zinc-cadmium efflux system membrane fusion protein